MQNLIVKNFKKDRINLISKERLKSYDDNINLHDENLKFIQQITIRIALIEIYLRNLVDFCLKNLHGDEWILKLDDEYINSEISKIKAKLKEPNCDQILSNLTLGNIIYILKRSNLQNAIFSLDKLDFKQFCKLNKNKFKNGSNLRNYHKVDIMLNLFSNIRNRSFHWENLYKMSVKNGKIVPRLSVSYKDSIIIGVEPEKIENFLECLLKNLSGD